MELPKYPSRDSVSWGPALKAGQTALSSRSIPEPHGNGNPLRDSDMTSSRSGQVSPREATILTARGVGLRSPDPNPQM